MGITESNHITHISGFKLGQWQNKIDTRDFVFENITPYTGDASFLVGPTEKTKKVWAEAARLLQLERDNGGVLAIDENTVSTTTSHSTGYIDKDNEVIVGLQTDEPLKRAIKPFGGCQTVINACKEQNKALNLEVIDIFNHYRKSHNAGVFSVYTEEMRNLRRTGVLTGLPDNYARGRIIADFRRVALYGIDRLIVEKNKDREQIDGQMMEDQIRLREEIFEQISALKDMQVMAKMYGFDISKPAQNAKEAIQWVYFGFLASIKEQDGAAMSLGNLDGFFDIYIERDLQSGLLDEAGAQELIDQFVIKLRLVRHLRPNAYEQIFAGDPTWATLSIGGSFTGKGHKINKTSFRILQTLYNMGNSPEPNITVLYSPTLFTQAYKDFCAQVSIDTSAIQYENDDMMTEVRGYDDYGIACCVSYQKTASQIQYFGARTNLAKTLLLAINGGRDEKAGTLLVQDIPALSDSEYLDYDEVIQNLNIVLPAIAKAYAKTMNVIHYMHDKYYYEKSQMALMDSELERTMAFGVAGISVIADSLSAIKYGKVKAIRNEAGLAIDFVVEGEYPNYGNDDDRVDLIAKNIIDQFNGELQKQYIYRQANPTLSVLTITSNVMYGEKTGATPDGRKAGQPFAPGGNPMHGRDSNGAIASLNSVAKLNYTSALDGISNTFSFVPKTLGHNMEERIDNLTTLIDGYFIKKGHHLNINVLHRETLLAAVEKPEEYPQLTIRVSGYAVLFIRLTPAQQKEVIARTFHESI